MPRALRANPEPSSPAPSPVHGRVRVLWRSHRPWELRPKSAVPSCPGGLERSLRMPASTPAASGIFWTLRVSVSREGRPEDQVRGESSRNQCLQRPGPEPCGWSPRPPFISFLRGQPRRPGRAARHVQHPVPPLLPWLGSIHQQGLRLRGHPPPDSALAPASEGVRGRWAQAFGTPCLLCRAGRPQVRSGGRGCRQAANAANLDSVSLLKAPGPRLQPTEEARAASRRQCPYQDQTREPE